MQIRRASRTDLPAIVAIEDQSFPDPWSQSSIAAYFGDPHAVILLAVDPQPVGFLIARREATPRGGWVFHIHDLAVAPTHRRQGAAGALLAELGAIARAQRASGIRLEVRVDNESAHRFYEHQGFKVVRELARYYEDGGAALRMELALTER